MRRAVGRLLRHAGYTVEEAADGLAAMARLDDGAAVDVVVSDVQMPRVNGLELARELRITRPALPVLLMTGYMPDAMGAVPAGVALIAKPFTSERLLDALERCLIGTRR